MKKGTKTIYIYLVPFSVLIGVSNLEKFSSNRKFFSKKPVQMTIT